MKNIHVQVSKSTAFDCEMVKKHSDLSDDPVIVKMKLKSNDCLPQTLKVKLHNGQIHVNVKNTGQIEVHIYKGKIIEGVDLRPAGYFHITKGGIQRFLLNRFIFLNESQDYFSICTHMMKNTRGIQELA